MAKKTKLKVTINGVEFTRETNHTYKYVLVGRLPYAREYAKASGWTADEEKSLKEHFEYLKSRANGEWYRKNGYTRRESDIALDIIYEAQVAAGIDALREDRKSVG